MTEVVTAAEPAGTVHADETAVPVMLTAVSTEPLATCHEEETT